MLFALIFTLLTFLACKAQPRIYFIVLKLLSSFIVNGISISVIALVVFKTLIHPSVSLLSLLNSKLLPLYSIDVKLLFFEVSTSTSSSFKHCSEIPVRLDESTILVIFLGKK